MASWRNPLRNYIDRLKGIRHTLTSQRDLFWARHRDAYRGECVEILRTQLMLVMPPDEPQGAWQASVERLAKEVADRVFADGDAVSLMIYIGAKNLPEVAGPLQELITRDIVLQWVRAGRAGDPYGKEFTNEDYPRSDEEIAWLVYLTNMRGRGTTTADSLRKFVNQKTVDQLQPYLQQVVKAWRLALVARIGTDFRAWVRSVIAESQG